MHNPHNAYKNIFRFYLSKFTFKMLFLSTLLPASLAYHFYFDQANYEACARSIDYFRFTGSPTLIQCAENSCSENANPRGLDQCYRLEYEARKNNYGDLPQGW